MLRRRAAFVIVLGLGLIAFDRFTAREVLAQDEYFLAAHHAGWIALGGAVMTLIGIYHWITGPTTPEI